MRVRITGEHVLTAGHLIVLALTIWFVVTTLHEYHYNNVVSNAQVQFEPDGIVLPTLYICPSSPNAGWIDYLEDVSCFLVDELVLFGATLPRLKELVCNAERASYPPIRSRSGEFIRCQNDTSTLCRTEIEFPCIKIFGGSGIRLDPGVPIVVNFKVYSSIHSTTPLNTVRMQWVHEDSSLSSEPAVVGNSMQLLNLGKTEVIDGEGKRRISVPPYVEGQLTFQPKLFSDRLNGIEEWSFPMEFETYVPIGTLMMMQQSVQLFEHCEWNTTPDCRDLFIALLSSMPLEVLEVTNTTVSARCNREPSPQCREVQAAIECALLRSLGRPLPDAQLCDLRTPTDKLEHPTVFSLSVAPKTQSIEVTETTEKLRIMDLIAIITGWTLFLLEFLHIIVSESVADRYKVIKVLDGVFGLPVPATVRRALGAVGRNEEGCDDESSVQSSSSDIGHNTKTLPDWQNTSLSRRRLVPLMVGNGDTSYSSS